MLGHRGCRLGITFPEIYRMQVRAIMEAACELVRERVRVAPEIMIPLVGMARELKDLREDTIRIAKEVMAEMGVKVRYSVGTMIEVPRAAITADEIAKEAEFFSFGTNDLTQMTLGISRDDAGEFIPTYKDIGIVEEDPFKTIDADGVGWLLRLSAAKGRSVNPNLSLSICGEHGGDPKSIEFFDKVGLDCVSMLPAPQQV